jgi:hypothetical protein
VLRHRRSMRPSITVTQNEPRAVREASTDRHIGVPGRGNRLPIGDGDFEDRFTRVGGFRSDKQWRHGQQGHAEGHDRVVPASSQPSAITSTSTISLTPTCGRSTSSPTEDRPQRSTSAPAWARRSARCLQGRPPPPAVRFLPRTPPAEPGTRSACMPTPRVRETARLGSAPRPHGHRRQCLAVARRPPRRPPRRLRLRRADRSRRLRLSSR